MRRVMSSRARVVVWRNSKQQTIHSSSSSLPLFKQNVSFHQIEINQFPIKIGDNPWANGMVCRWFKLVGWLPDQTDVLDLEWYESSKTERRDRHEFHMPAEIRQALLFLNGAKTQQDMVDAILYEKCKREKRIAWDPSRIDPPPLFVGIGATETQKSSQSLLDVGTFAPSLSRVTRQQRIWRPRGWWAHYYILDRQTDRQTVIFVWLGWDTAMLHQKLPDGLQTNKEGAAEPTIEWRISSLFWSQLNFEWNLPASPLAGKPTELWWFDSFFLLDFALTRQESLRRPNPEGTNESYTVWLLCIVGSNIAIVGTPQVSERCKIVANVALFRSRNWCGRDLIWREHDTLDILRDWKYRPN
jgi:hypothetical protein